MEYTYLDVIEFMDYPVNYEVGLAYYWLHPEYISKKIITLGKFDYGFYKMPEVYTNTTYLSGEPLKSPITVRIVDFKGDLFRNNTEITDLVLSKYQSELPKEAFLNMRNLKRIWIPKGVTYILKDTFKGCDNLEEIYYEGSMEEFKKIDVYYKLYRVIPKLGLQDEIEEYYDLGNLPFINAKVYYNQVRDMERTSEYIAKIGNVDVKNIFKNK
jgi:hypothetical protein